MPAQFLNHVKNYENSCKKLCTMNSKKFILDIEMCVDNCFSETEYKYEYQNMCYKKCPIRTQLKSDSTYLCEDCPHFYNYEGTGCIDDIPEGYYLNSSFDKTIDICPSKCKSCSLQSMVYDLCIECNINNNFYTRYNDVSNRDSFNQCYNSSEEQIGYYLDNVENILRQCYYKCKKCNKKGNDDNNNCLECNDDYEINNGNCIKILENSNQNNDIIRTYSSNNIIPEKKEGNKYSYEIKDIEEAKNNKTQIYIDIEPEIIKSLKE